MFGISKGKVMPNSNAPIYKWLTFKESLKELKFPFERDDIVDYNSKLYTSIKNMNEEIKDWSDVYKVFGIRNSKDIIVDSHPFMESRKTIHPDMNAVRSYEKIYLELSFSIGKSDDIWFWKQKMSHDESMDDMERLHVSIRYKRQISYQYYFIYCTITHVKRKRK